MFKGSLVAIVTPFKNGQVDERALGDLIEFQITNGTDGIVPCGTSGESATLTYEKNMTGSLNLPSKLPGAAYRSLRERNRIPPTKPSR